jgi:hypothetical protein
MTGQFFTGAEEGQEPASARRGRWIDGICWGLVILGAGLRIYQWMHNRSLWVDESYLAINILERGFGELHQPLEFSQSAPWLFLIASKAMVALFGPGEMVLRFIPLVASILSLWVLWRLARECFDGWVVPVALAIFTFAYPHLYYAQELKQYSLDILLTTVVTWQAALMFKSAKSPGQYFTGIAVAGCFGIFAMHAMPFVLAGIGLITLRARRKGLLNLSYARLLTAVGVWLLLFAVNYFIIIKPNYTDPVMKNFWAFAYPGVPWTLEGLRSWSVLTREYFWYLGYGGFFKAFAVVLLMGGLWRMIRARNLVLLSCAVMAAAYWVAGMAGKAPFSGRLVLFLFPVFTLFLGQGLDLLTRGRHWLLGGVAAALILWPTCRGLANNFRPIEKENIRGPIVQLAKLRKGSEPVHVMFWAVPAYRYYRQVLGLTNLSDPIVVLSHQERVFEPSKKKGTPPKSMPDIKQVVGEMSGLLEHKKLWLLAAHMSQYEDQLLREVHESLGLTPDMIYKAKECSLYRFDVGQSSRVSEKR